MEAGKPKIWSVTDFLGSAPQNTKDSMGFVFPKMDGLKTNSEGNSLGMVIDTRVSPMTGRSSAASNGLASIPNSTHHIAYQSSLGYGGGACPYSLSSYGGGKLLRPSLSPATSRFNPFPSVRPLGMDSPYAPRRDLALAREGE